MEIFQNSINWWKMGHTENFFFSFCGIESYRIHGFILRQILEAYIFSETLSFIYAAERDYFYLGINSKA